MIITGDCIEVMRGLPDASIDAIVTDPPYELGFMGKGWDATGIANSVPMWSEALRVLKPGGHLAAFGGTRTYHRMACAIEDAGFEIRNTLAWMYGSGFPKSLNVSKAIDSTLINGGSNSRRLRQTEQDGGGEAYTLTGKNNGIMGETVTVERKVFTPATDAARQWEGWGTALKPAYEPIILARKPLIGTVAGNVLQYGTGAINVDGCRIGTEGGTRTTDGTEPNRLNAVYGDRMGGLPSEPAGGRWPANVLMDDEAAAILDAQAGEAGGGPSRFFYTAKASRAEREAGLTAPESGRANTHPTVKPVALMRWLVTLVTPPGGHVLDPFAGSGTTGIACAELGVRFTGIEKEPEYAAIARQRIEAAVCHARGDAGGDPS